MNQLNGDSESQQIQQLDKIRNLRDRGTIKPPNRYQANIAVFNEPSSYEDTMSGEDAYNWKKAIEDELKAHELNGTWIYEDLPEGKRTVGSRWVFKIKYNSHEDTHRYKARLCAKGFTQKQGVDYQEVYAPVARYDSIRAMLARAAQENMKIGQFYVKTAFLNGELNEEIYMDIYMPDGVTCSDKNKVCKLLKSLYGLKQASRSWNSKFDSFLKRFHFKSSKADACIYTGNFESYKVYLIIYVDDGLILSTSQKAIDKVINELKSNFRITIGNAKSYVGIKIIRDIERKSIFIHQTSYIRHILQRFNMTDCKVKSIPADLDTCLTSANKCETVIENVPYRQAIDALMFLSIVTRPDITYIVNLLE